MDAHQLNIRHETQADYDSVRHINEAAFDTSAEAKLVDALRVSVEPYISLVAERDGEVRGHILFTPVTVENFFTERFGLAHFPLSRIFATK